MRYGLYSIALILLGVSMGSILSKNSLIVTSKSFKPGQSIPSKHSYTKGNSSPHLSWSQGPEGTKCYVLIVDDPDAPRSEPWVHWVVFNIPAEIREFQEGSFGGQEGMNDYQQVGWGGPNPPSGTHRYFFKLYALREELKGLSSKTTKKDLEKAMNGKILAEGSLMGTYVAQK